MPSILGANTLSSGYDVANSVRFDDGSGAELTRSQGSSPSSQRLFTFSGWYKRGNLNSGGSDPNMQMFSQHNDTTDRMDFRFQSGDTIDFRNNAPRCRITTNRLFRDVSAWYHVCLRVDTTQSTAANRIRLYINGVQETSFSAADYGDQNDDLITDASTFDVGDDSSGNSHFDGYMSEVVYCNGQSLAPTSFGEFDEDSGIWKPINVSGLTFGTNGFYLDFEDSSALGNDVSGNNNDFTANNLAATDQSTDTCTNNFATWNPLRKHLAFTATFSEGNTIVEHGQADQNQTVFSTMAVSTGKWYAEFQCSTNASNFAFGIARINTTNSGGLDSYPGSLGGMHYAKNGEIQWYAGGDANSDTSTTFAHTDIIGVLFDLDNTRLYFYKNDTLVNSGGIDYSVGTAVDGSTSETTYYFAAGSSDGGTNPVLQANFGGSSGFAISSGNADPNGYGNFEFATKGGYALCTKNLAEYG